jgi:two-component system LytT family response regulator
MENKIRTILIDDENDSIDVLKYLLKNYAGDFEIVGIASNVKDAYEKIILLQPNIIFLDINMPKENGFELLKKIEKINFEIVFITSHNQYAINAIKFNALDYILKPIAIDEFKETINKARQSIQQKNNNYAQIVNLINVLEKDQNDLKIAVHNNNKVKMISINEIITICSEGRYSILSMKNNENHTVARHLKDFEFYLSNNINFIRINKSVLININFIKEYSKNIPWIIELTNGLTYEVPRRKRAEIHEKIKQNILNNK